MLNRVYLAFLFHCALLILWQEKEYTASFINSYFAFFIISRVKVLGIIQAFIFYEHFMKLTFTEKCKPMWFKKPNISVWVIVTSKPQLMCSNILNYFSRQFHSDHKSLSMCPVLTSHFKFLSPKCYDIGFGITDSFHRQRQNEEALKHFKTWWTQIMQYSKLLLCSLIGIIMEVFLYRQRYFLKVGLWSYSKWILVKTLTLMLPSRAPCVY